MGGHREDRGTEALPQEPRTEGDGGLESPPVMLHRLLASCLPLVPTPVMRRLSARYISGETLIDALGRLEDLRTGGFPGVIDLLGEEVPDSAAADAACQEYLAAAEGIALRSLDAYVSIKPTHFGLALDAEACLARFRRVAERCGELGLRVRIEMEDVRYTDATLSLYEALRSTHPGIGIVVQARLFRTPADIDSLGPGEHDVRLVKGVYLEPAEIAHTDPQAISDAYVACAEQLLAHGACVSFATHDDVLVERLAEVISSAGAQARHELQVLDGVRPSYWQTWRAAGHTVRVYVPYGPDWRAYSTRRMRKNPQMFKAVLRSMLFSE